MSVDVGPTESAGGPRRPGGSRLTPVDFGDDASLGARIRRHIRNPSVLTIILGIVVAIAIPGAILGPGLYRTAKENLAEAEQLRKPPIVEVTAPSWIFPYLNIQTSRMLEAQEPVDWRGVSFKLGPCSPDNLSQLPDAKYADAIALTCRDLDRIQLDNAGLCAETGKCNIPESVKEELRSVLNRLENAFSDAGLVEPYPVEEQSSR